MVTDKVDKRLMIVRSDMSYLFRILTIFVFIAGAGCGLNEKTLQPAATPIQTDKQHDIHVSFNFDTGNGQGSRVSGFRLYQEGNLICETNDPSSKTIDCTIASPGGSFLFTLTVYYDDGSESTHSEPFSYVIPD